MTVTINSVDTPRVWIGCLAARNNGILHGEWIELDGTIDVDDLHGIVQTKILHTSPEHDPHGLYGPAEEWYIGDIDNFGNARISEYGSFADIVGIAELITTHGEPFLAWLSNRGEPMSEWDNYDHDEMFRGAYESSSDWAWEDAEEDIEKVNKLFGEGHHAFRFDWEEYVLMAEANGGYDFVDYDRRVFVFNNA